jgi:hypothetical protein
MQTVIDESRREFAFASLQPAPHLQPKGARMRWMPVIVLCVFSTIARAQSIPPGGTSIGPTTRPHGTGTARPMTPMERIAELERRVAELERLVAQLTGTTQPGDSSATQPVVTEAPKSSIFDTPAPPKPDTKAASVPKPRDPDIPPGMEWTTNIHFGDTKEAIDKAFADWKCDWVSKYSDAQQKTYRYTNPKTGKKFVASFKRSNNKLDSWSSD